MPDCVLCGLETGRPRSAWHRKCRRRAERRWKAGLRAADYPDGGRRGRVPLGVPTKGERERERVRAEAFEQGRLAGVKEAVMLAMPAVRELRELRARAS